MEIDRSLESQESSSPIVTRAVAAGLAGKPCDVYSFPGWQKFGLNLLGYLPQQIGRYIIPRVQPGSAFLPEEVQDLSIEHLIQKRLEDYKPLGGRFPAILAGVAQGGATAHLALSLHGPFLPEAFVVTVRGGSVNGNVRTYFNRSAALAEQVARRHPGVLTIQHYDPVHDGWLTRFVNHLRVKLLDLPEAYRRFIRERLEPGGEVCYLQGGAQWLRYRVGERSVFQVGGWGDLPAGEFIQGSERITRVCRGEGIREFDWALPGYPLEAGPESEWGSEAGLGDALETFCSEDGYRFRRIFFPEPNGFSRLAFEAVNLALQKEGREPAGAVIEMFSQFDAFSVQESGLAPVWLVFNTKDSLDFLKEMAPRLPAGKPVFFTPLSTFSITPDLVPWKDWEGALNGLDWINCGARPSHYPADPQALIQWNRPLRAWSENHRDPIRGRVSVEELAELAARIQST